MMDDIILIDDIILTPEMEAELSCGLESSEDAETIRAPVTRDGLSLLSATDTGSKLVNYTRLSPNYSVRTGKISKITIHHMAGNLTVERCGEEFAKTSRQASANYGIGSDGRIACYVPENYRAWTSSSSANDNVAVTIEVANSVAADPWPVSDAAYESLIRLCVDICQRNGIAALNYTGDKSGNLTAHRWFAATLCPGPYLYERFPAIAAEVNRRLAAGSIYPVEDERAGTEPGPYKEDDEMLTYEQWKAYMERYMSEAVVSEPSRWAKESADKAIAKGLIQGDGKGAYNWQKPLTREAYLVMQDRAGLL